MSDTPDRKSVFADDCYIIKTNTRGTTITIADCSDYGVFSASPNKDARSENLFVYPYQSSGPALLAIEPIRHDGEGLLERIRHLKEETVRFHVRDLGSDDVIGTLSVDHLSKPPQKQKWIVEAPEDSEPIIIQPSEPSSEKLRFSHIGSHGETEVCVFESADGIGTRWVKADFSMDTERELDVRLGVAVAVKLVEGIVLHGFHSDDR